MSQDRPNDRILQHLAHQFDEQAPDVATYLQITAEGRGILAGMRAVIHAEHLGVPTQDLGMATKALLEKISHHDSSFPEKTPVVRRDTAAPRALYPFRWPILGVAMMGMVLVALAWQGGAHRVRKDLSENVFTYVTGNREQSTISLPDGSTVVLNVASRLDVPADYNTGARTLTLKGEALFTVAHNAGAPFTVVAGPSTTRVLGTSFLVRHYPDDTAATVAVRDGKVVVASRVLTANTQIQVSKTGISPIFVAKPAQFTFAKGVLTLDGISLSDAAPMLGRWFDADIRLGDPALAEQRVNGEFAVGSIADLTDMLEWMFNVRIIQTGRVLTLFPR